MSNKWITRIFLGSALLIGTPLTARAQQLYECKWTVTIREITTRKADGSYTTTWEYERTEVCRPISPT